jgi:hypothetical protein
MVQKDDVGPKKLWRYVNIPAQATSIDDPLGREVGEWMTHPNVPENDRAALEFFWKQRREETKIDREWHALYQGDPRPPDDQLVPYEVVRDRMHIPPPSGPVLRAVGVDPSITGTGDLTGITAGYLAEDTRVYITHDRSMLGGDEEWTEVAVRLAHDTHADIIVYERNQGGKAWASLLRAAWQRLYPTERLMPRFIDRHAVVDKWARAQAPAQAIKDDQVRFASNELTELLGQFTDWSPAAGYSPDRLDSAVWLISELLSQPGGAAVVYAPPAGAPLLRKGPYRNVIPFRGRRSA